MMTQKQWDKQGAWVKATMWRHLAPFDEQERIKERMYRPFYKPRKIRVVNGLKHYD